jgi:hypothetical protein
MRVTLAGTFAVVLIAVSTTIAGAAERSVPEARQRVAHHLREVEAVAARLGVVLAEPCPRFQSHAEWDQYEDARVEDVVLLLAHLKQALAEAKTVKDEELRREARAPRSRAEEARRLVAKLQGCAVMNDAALDLVGIMRRIEEEVPRRRAEIKLPE